MVKPHAKVKRKTNYARVIVIAFALVIIAGAFVLTLPVSNADGQRESFFTCLFTSTSATCVTGLVLVDTAIHWSAFGQAVILLLIQIGGLGIMTLAVSLSMLVKRAISPKERLIMAQSVNSFSASGLVRLTKRILIGTVVSESAGALILMTRFVPVFGASGIWKAVFISVSAFCNAGFDIMGTYSGEFSSLTAFSGDPVVCITVMLLILVGGIGFIVWDDLHSFILKRKKMYAYTKMVLSFSAALIILGAVCIMATEWSNPDTLGNMSVGDKIINSFFQSVTPRTAGFNTIDLTALGKASQLMLIGLMFIGGCSGSTAGGIKVGTFGIIMLTVMSVLRGKTDVSVFNRRLTDSSVLRAFSLAAVQLFVTLAGGIIVLGSGDSILQSMFEAFSASGTVGLTLSVTPGLGTVPLCALMVLMFFGRVGIITVSCATMMKISQTTSEYKKAEARMIVG